MIVQHKPFEFVCPICHARSSHDTHAEAAKAEADHAAQDWHHRAGYPYTPEPGERTIVS